MGHHYNPQAHLCRFEIDGKPEFIWMYDKKTRKWSEASISKVAQERGYYSQEVERALAELVERPANICIDRLLRKERLDNAARTQLALYMMIMTTRGPRQRRKSFARAPEDLESAIGDVESEIKSWVAEDEPDIELASARLQELQSVRDRFSKELPQPVIEQIRTPFWSERTVECILNMAWHILPAPPSVQFVTSDTPAHFFDGLGVGKPDSEFTFTISKNFALIGEHQRSWGTVFEKPQLNLAKEVNRRILSHAERFVFSPKKADWIETVSQKADPFLSRIVWR
jgi:hypothetical protein